MAKVNLKHSGAVIDQQIDRVLDGSVVVENTLSALDLESKKPVDSQGIASAIEAASNNLKARGYIFMGVATPSTRPDVSGGKVFYLAAQAGEYTNFSYTLPTDALTSLEWNGERWFAVRIADLVTPAEVEQAILDNTASKVTEDGTKPVSGGAVVDYYGEDTRITGIATSGATDISGFKEGDYCQVASVSGETLEIYEVYYDNTFRLLGTANAEYPFEFFVGPSVKSVRMYWEGSGYHYEIIRRSRIFAELSGIRRLTFDTVGKNVLLFGDSYSRSDTGWSRYFKELSNTNIISLAVTSATVKDKYADRTAYPYTDRPKDNQNAGNLNTLACQIAKLKRLMLGEDLDAGEKKIYEGYSPDIIIIQGGINDSVDSDEKVSAYNSQFVKYKDNLWVATRPNQSPTQRGLFVARDIEDVDRTSFAGAYRYIVQELRGLFPKAQIFIVSVVALGNYTGSVLNTRHNVFHQQMECAQLCSATFIDWYTNSQISTIGNTPVGDGTEDSPYIIEGPTEDSTDSLHPNERGSRKLAQIVYKALLYNGLKM